MHGIMNKLQILAYFQYKDASIFKSQVLNQPDKEFSYKIPGPMVSVISP